MLDSSLYLQKKKKKKKKKSKRTYLTLSISKQNPLEHKAQSGVQGCIASCFLCWYFAIAIHV